MIAHPSTVTTLSPDRLAEPPPRTFTLTDAERAVGWVHGDAIGFLGFADETEAVHAAWVAHRTIARRLAPRDGRRPVPIDSEPLALDRRRGVERILAGGAPIATLVRPREAGALEDPSRDHVASGDDSFGFELRVPPPADELTVRALAHLAYRALRKSGLPWAMWRRAGERTRDAAPVARKARRHRTRAHSRRWRRGRRWAWSTVVVMLANAVILLAALALPWRTAIGVLGLGVTALVLAHRVLTAGARPRPSGAVGVSTRDAPPGAPFIVQRATVRRRPLEDGAVSREGDDVHEAALGSFPASDPPSWSALRAGPPMKRA